MASPEEFQPLRRRPLYLLTQERLRTILKTRTPGERIETEPEWQRRLGVSSLTLRRAMSELEREGIIQRRQGSGTFYLGENGPAKKHVAVLLNVDETSPTLSPFFVHLVRQIRHQLRAMGIASRPYQGDLPLGEESPSLHCPDLLDDIRLDRVSGLIAFFTHRHADWWPLVDQRNIPVIDTEIMIAQRKPSSFLEWAIDLAHEQGRRKVAAVNWESKIDPVRPFSDRLIKLTSAKGLTLNRSWLDMEVNGWEPGMGWERFRDIWLRTPDKPDVLIIGDDMIFSDVQRAIQEMRIRVPDDLLVVARNSDAVPLNIQIPVWMEKTRVSDQAKIYAEAIRDLLAGKPVEHFSPPPFKRTLITPGGIDADPSESLLSFNS